MKKTKLLFSIIFIFVISLFLFSCNKEEKSLPTVTYELNGGIWTDTLLIEKEPYELSYEEGSYIKEPLNPKKDGYNFIGWFMVFKEKEANEQVKENLSPNKFLFETYKIKDDIILRAKYEKIS